MLQEKAKAARKKSGLRPAQYQAGRPARAKAAGQNELVWRDPLEFPPWRNYIRGCELRIASAIGQQYRIHTAQLIAPIQISDEPLAIDKE